MEFIIKVEDPSYVERVEQWLLEFFPRCPICKDYVLPAAADDEELEACAGFPITCSECSEPVEGVVEEAAT